MTFGDSYDVVVVGAGNAALSAALSARDGGARVLVLEKAPVAERGGNTAFTGGLFRFPFNSIDDIRPLIPDYSRSPRLSTLNSFLHYLAPPCSDLKRTPSSDDARWVEQNSRRWKFH